MVIGNFEQKKQQKKVEKSNLEILENFRDAKNSLYLQVGNMQDINNMSLSDFNHLYEYVERRDKINKHEPVKLRESNRRMIQATKNKKRKK